MKNKVEQDIVATVDKLYNWIDSNIPSPNPCDACGRCCDFKTYDHRLFVTPPEMIHFKAKLAPEKIKTMTTDTCPYNINGKCTAYPYRFASCRIFNCKTDAAPQADLTEAALTQLKKICEKFDLQYNYVELKTALNKSAP